jgi:cysteine synthase A
MPNSMSIERVKLLKAYGAELVLTDGSLGMKGAIEKAEEIHKNTPNSFIAGQFENPANPEIHYLTTAPEIYNALDGKVDIFIAGIGTGGTITGVGKYLKEKNPNVQIIGVEPLSSPYLTKGIAGKHGLQGIGAGFIPKILDTTVYSEVIAVTEEDAYKTGRELGKTEGLLVGISSSAVLYAGLQIANRKENQGKNIVMLFPDFGDRYLATKLFEE